MNLFLMVLLLYSVKGDWTKPETDAFRILKLVQRLVNNQGSHWLLPYSGKRPVSSHLNSLLSNSHPWPPTLRPSPLAPPGHVGGRSWGNGGVVWLESAELCAVLVFGGPECGSHNYSGNVSLCSARTRPEKPTALFKEMTAKGPSAVLFPSLFQVFSLFKASLPL